MQFNVQMELKPEKNKKVGLRNNHHIFAKQACLYARGWHLVTWKASSIYILQLLDLKSMGV